VNLKDMKGKAIVVCFWSPANKSSQGELSQIASLFDEFRKKGMDAVAVSLDPNATHMMGALDDFSTPFPNVPDRSGVARRHNISNASVPQTFVLNQNHEIIASGLHGNELQNAVVQLMKGQ
jgi:peroxiredoxin